MSFLNIIKSINRNENSLNEMKYIPFALLNEEEMPNFTSGLFQRCEHFYEEALKKTGDCSFTDREKMPYKKRRRISVDYYIAALEALQDKFSLCAPDSDLLSFRYLKHGKTIIFKDCDCLVECIRTDLTEFLYKSPHGNIIIRENLLNNKIFEIYVSENVTEELYKRLLEGLNKALDIKDGSIKSSIDSRFNVINQKIKSRELISGTKKHF